MRETIARTSTASPWASTVPPSCSFAATFGGIPPPRNSPPAWLPVVEALASLGPGGRLVINAIRKDDRDRDELLGLRYETHLWQEKSIRSVANVTAADIAAFLPLAGEVPLAPEVEVYPFERANDALRDLRFGAIRGAKVLDVCGPDRDRSSA